MSYEKVKAISIDKKNNQVFITSACNNIIPLNYSKWGCKPYSDILKKRGLIAVQKEILYQFAIGNFQGQSTDYAKSLCLLTKHQKDFVHDSCFNNHQTSINKAKELLYINYKNFTKKSLCKVIIATKSCFISKCTPTGLKLSFKKKQAKIFKNIFYATYALSHFDNDFLKTNNVKIISY
jgi:hypothetical protein